MDNFIVIKSWRKMRRASHEGFSTRACEQYQPALLRGAALNILEMTRTPDAWLDHLKQ
jgi:hypothetical protein